MTIDRTMHINAKLELNSAGAGLHTFNSGFCYVCC